MPSRAAVTSTIVATATPIASAPSAERSGLARTAKAPWRRAVTISSARGAGANGGAVLEIAQRLDRPTHDLGALGYTVDLDLQAADDAGRNRYEVRASVLAAEHPC